MVRQGALPRDPDVHAVDALSRDRDVHALVPAGWHFLINRNRDRSNLQVRDRSNLQVLAATAGAFLPSHCS
jgi:hypothetical protein